MLLYGFWLPKIGFRFKPERISLLKFRGEGQKMGEQGLLTLSKKNILIKSISLLSYAG
jgi:hypothetical protein